MVYTTASKSHLVLLTIISKLNFRENHDTSLKILFFIYTSKDLEIKYQIPWNYR